MFVPQTLVITPLMLGQSAAERVNAVVGVAETWILSGADMHCKMCAADLANTSPPEQGFDCS